MGLADLQQPQPTVQLRPLEDFDGDLEAWSDGVDEYRKFSKLAHEIKALKENVIVIEANGQLTNLLIKASTISLQTSPLSY